MTDCGRHHCDLHNQPFACLEPSCNHLEGFASQSALLHHYIDNHGDGKDRPAEASKWTPDKPTQADQSLPEPKGSLGSDVFQACKASNSPAKGGEQELPVSHSETAGSSGPASSGAPTPEEDSDGLIETQQEVGDSQVSSSGQELEDNDFIAFTEVRSTVDESLAAWTTAFD